MYTRKRNPPSFTPHISTHPSSELLNLLDEEDSCYLCDKLYIHKSRLKQHFKRCHLNHKIELGFLGFPTSYLCKLPCIPGNAGHYHCHCCDFLARTSERLCTHVKFKHFQDVENKKKSFCKLVNQKDGIYMVSKHRKGDQTPVHVKHKQTHNMVEFECQNASCKESMEISHVNNILNMKCNHLNQVTTIKNVEDPWYKEGFQTSKLTDKEKAILSKAANNILGKNVDPVVPWEHSKRYMYYSVFAFKASYSPIERLFVKVERETGQFFCDCRHSSKLSDCLHVILTKVYQDHKGDATNTVTATATAFNDSTSATDDNSADVTVNNISAARSPPADAAHSTSAKKIVLSTEELEYQFENKKYPVEFPNSLQYKSKEDLGKIKNLVPKETVCHKCKAILSEPVQYARSARILDTKTVVTDVHLFYKICNECGHRYFYKEYNDGVHVSTNNVILSLNVCILIRSGLSSGTAVGRSGNTVLKLLDNICPSRCVKINDIRESYQQFEVMTAHPYAFTCDICGYFPKILMTDVCRKTFTKLPINAFTDGNDEPRKMSSFWSHVEKCVLQTRKDNLEEEINMWSPWISPINVKDNVYSTEFKKGSQKDVTIEEEIMVTEEEFTDELKNQPKKQLLHYLKETLKVNVDPKASKEKLVSEIIKQVFATNAFNKKLFSVFGGSGGLLALSCTHGIVYGMKVLLKHESPRDYVDVILSMKYPPGILICDMPDRIAKNLSKRSPGTLQPNNGMLTQCTEANIQSAKQKTLKVFIPFLQPRSINIPETTDHNYESVNPVTRTAKMYVLYDEFHKSNSKKPSEVLRHTNLIDGLTNLNTQVSEQLNSRIGRTNYFVDKLSPVPHCFFLRLIIELMNREQNKNNCKNRLKHTSGYVLKRDELGRMFHSTCPTPTEIIDETSDEGSLMSEQNVELSEDLLNINKMMSELIANESNEEEGKNQNSPNKKKKPVAQDLDDHSITEVSLDEQEVIHREHGEHHEYHGVSSLNSVLITKNVISPVHTTNTVLNSLSNQSSNVTPKHKNSRYNFKSNVPEYNASGCDEISPVHTPNTILNSLSNQSSNVTSKHRNSRYNFKKNVPEYNASGCDVESLPQVLNTSFITSQVVSASPPSVSSTVPTNSTVSFGKNGTLQRPSLFSKSSQIQGNVNLSKNTSDSVCEKLDQTTNVKAHCPVKDTKPLYDQFLTEAIKSNTLRRNYLLFEYSSRKIFVQDIQTMCPKNQLNDVAVDVSLQILVNENPATQLIPTCVFADILANPDKLNVINFDLQKEVIFLPWCESDHWRLVILYPTKNEWELMDPIGVMKTDVNKIRDNLISAIQYKTNSVAWTQKTRPYLKQSDMTSCGAFVIQYAYTALNVLKKFMQYCKIDDFRLYLIDKILKKGEIPKEYCSYCSLKRPKHKKSKTWIQCDSCDRWQHDVCITNQNVDIDLLNISSLEFKCEVCKVLQQSRVPQTQQEASSTTDKLFEIVILEKTRARKCGGCKNQLIARGKNHPLNTTVGLRTTYEATFFNPRANIHQTSTNNLYLHSNVKCLNGALPGTLLHSLDQLTISKKTYFDVINVPEACNKFQREFNVDIRSISNLTN